jgi:hypothetical protein
MSEPAAPVSTVRAIIAVLGALVLFSGLSQVLEFMLVRAAAGEAIPSLAGYLAVLNRPVLLAAKAALNVMVAVLTGYTCARIAGGREMLFAGLAAAAESCTLAWGFTTGEYTALPVWVRVLILLTAGPAMLAGAWIRLQARLALGGDVASPADTASSEDDVGTGRRAR